GLLRSKGYRLGHECELERSEPCSPAPNLAYRWNNHCPVPCTSDCLALAPLEILGGWVRCNSLDGCPRFPYDLSQAEISDARRTNPQLYIHSKPATKRFGDEWARTARSLSLGVPSVRLPFSWNYLINPHHSSFSEQKIEHLGRLHWHGAIGGLLRAGRR